MNKLLIINEYNTNYKKYLLFATKIVGTKQNAEDAVQAGFMNAIKYSDKFQNKSSLQSWLCEIVANSSKALYKKEKVKSKYMDLLKKDVSFMEIQDAESKFIATENHIELVSTINKTIEDMSPRKRQALKLKYYEGATANNISEIMGISENTAKSMWLQGVNDIKRTLDQKEIKDCCCLVSLL